MLLRYRYISKRCFDLELELELIEDRSLTQEAQRAADPISLHRILKEVHEKFHVSW